MRNITFSSASVRATVAPYNADVDVRELPARSTAQQNEAPDVTIQSAPQIPPNDGDVEGEDSLPDINEAEGESIEIVRRK